MGSGPSEVGMGSGPSEVGWAVVLVRWGGGPEVGAVVREGGWAGPWGGGQWS